MFEQLILSLPDHLRPLAMKVIETGVAREIRNLKINTDPLEVTKDMGICFREGRTRGYEYELRGYIFKLLRFRDYPYEEHPPEDYRVKMWPPYPKGKPDDRSLERLFDIDYDDCHLEYLTPVIQHLLDTTPFPTEFEEKDFIDRAFKLIVDREKFIEVLKEEFYNQKSQEEDR